MRALLDVNVLIALLDRRPHTARARHPLVCRPGARRLGFLSDHPERLCADRVASGVSESSPGRRGRGAPGRGLRHADPRILAGRHQPARCRCRRSGTHPRTAPAHRCLPFCARHPAPRTVRHLRYRRSARRRPRRPTTPICESCELFCKVRATSLRTDIGAGPRHYGHSANNCATGAASVRRQQAASARAWQSRIESPGGRSRPGRTPTEESSRRRTPAPAVARIRAPAHR